MITFGTTAIIMAISTLTTAATITLADTTYDNNDISNVSIKNGKNYIYNNRKRNDNCNDNNNIN